MKDQVLQSTLFDESRMESEVEHSDSLSDAEVFFKLFFPVFKMIQRQQSNMAFSPIGFVSKICLLYEFTKGICKDELRTCLFDRCGVYNIGKLNMSVSRAINEMNNSVYNLCSSYFYIDFMYSVAWDSRFISMSESCFGCTIRSLDFASFPISSVREVNEDVCYSTSGKVSTIVGAVESHTKTLITDIHYFSCLQDINFAENKYFVDIFQCRNDESNTVEHKQVPYFSGVGFVKIGFNDSLQTFIVEIPLKYSDLTLKIILPPPDKSVSQFLEENEPLSICKTILDNRSLVIKRVRLDLPKVDITTNVSIKNLLQCCGISSLFNESCDLVEATLSTEAASGLFIDDMLQKVVVSLNDQRNKLTEMCGELKESRDSDEQKLQISRPFLYAVTARVAYRKKQILLMGIVNDVSEE